MRQKTVSGGEFSAVSYERHAQVYSNYAAGGARSETARSWLRAGTINSWRFERMYVCASPLLEAFPGANWLTVGDGRFGMDAMYLQAHGARALFRRVSGKIARYDLLCRLGINQPGLLAAIIFKESPSVGVKDALRRHGYDVVDLPENPFVAVTQSSET